MSICILGDQYDIDCVKYGGVDVMSVDDFKKFNKNKKFIKKFVCKYDVFVVFDIFIKQIFCLLGFGFFKGMLCCFFS